MCLWALAGCQHVDVAPLVPQETTFQIFTGKGTEEPPGGDENADTMGELSEGEIFKPAQAILPLAVPVYPSISVDGRGRLVRVGVGLVIDQTGRVTEVKPSMVYLSTPHPEAKTFFDAVKTAVEKWKFIPAQSVKIEQATGDDGGTWWRAGRSEPVETSGEVLFTFTATGEVKME